jgi:tRNA G10  N-methylase Trm11
MLCRMSDPKHTDVVVDPFCGYGSILAERMKHFPLQRFYAFDIDEAVLERARKRIPPKLKDACTVRRADFHTLPDLLPEGSLDAIITDPPWGMYAPTGSPPEEFYRNMIAVFLRLLKKGGIIVLLTALGDILKDLVAASPGLEITQALSVLVSGQKAWVFKLKKR